MTYLMKPIEELAVRAVRLGRELSGQLARVPRLLEPSRLGPTLRRLDDGDPFDGRDLATLEAIAATLDEWVADGIRGTRVELGAIGTDECGDEVFGFVEVPVLTPAAEEMTQLRRRLDEFMFVRSVVIDRVAAERAIALLSRR